MAEPEKEFDEQQNTRQFVTEEVLPRVTSASRQVKAVVFFGSLILAVFTAGQVYHACTQRYESAAAAAARDQLNAAEHAAMKREIQENHTHLEQHDVLIDQQRTDGNWMKQTMFDMAKHLGTRPAPPPKDGR